MACIEIGVGSKARGIGCVAVGDYTEARGAFQVNIGESITIPVISPDKIKILIDQLTDSILTYNELSKTKYAPELFGRKAEAAIRIVIDILEARLVSLEIEEEKK